ncbi:MAG: ankyrin repeat domain-containing protein [Myxococcales bacterium]|nr:ankyrin repeat domain-containing protein [Myxococcales bacterium]
MTPEQLRTGDLAALESFVAQHGLDVPAELLLDAGADVNATDADGMTVLHLACRCPRRTSVETARLLRARGADRFGKNADGRTAYQYAMARPPGTWVTPELLRELM